jgi:parallel beta-helix repeat protein
MGMKKFLLFAIFLISLSFLISSVKAITYISGCSNLNQEGETYYLTADIIDSSISPCMTISANNIILDCQNHAIDGDDVAGYGIHVSGITNITIKNCILSDWATASIYLFSSSNNQIINSTANSNRFGIWLSSSSNNQIINSTANSNYYGIYLLTSSNNQIINSVMNSNEFGIYLNIGEDNQIYNNLFNNNYNFRFKTILPNYWNTTKQLGQRIYSLGNYIGGNYWTNPAGNGYSDTCADDDRDGFCDLPYDLLGDGTNVDYLPLSNKYAPPNLPPEITIFSPLNQSYYGSIDFAFKVIDYSVENFTVRTYLNNQLEYENLYYQNNTQTSYSKSLPIGTYNFTVYAEDSYGASSQQEVIFTSLGYCGDSICQVDYENSANCFKDCGGTARQFTVGIGSVVLAFGGLMLLATAFASSPTEGKDYVFKIFIAVIGIILMVYGIIYLFNL